MYFAPGVANVLFCDEAVLTSNFSDFTAWSSTRDPSQVFILLQTVYQAFDEIANRRGVFKVLKEEKSFFNQTILQLTRCLFPQVETIGDSYGTFFM